MLSQEAEERLAQRLVDRIEDTNATILKKIGEAIKRISTLSPSQAYQVSQILKYGGSYEEIAKELAKVSGKNVQDIYKIFDEVAKENKQFAKDFYKYRGMDFIPYNKDIALQNQVRSIARLTANTYVNIARTNMIGLVVDGQFKDLQQAYYDIIDKAILSVSQGKQDFYSSMRNTLKELGGNGLVEYRSGYKRRLDSSVRMNMLDGIRQLNMETSKRFGQEYDADGIEISVHSNPAPDHADIQGRQFSNEEYEILENGGTAKDIKGNKYDGTDKRHIGELNCYHRIFPIVIGVSKPEYTDEQLKKIQEDNEKGFELNGKHYTNYEGTQLQRKLETEIRRQKDTQILAKASGDMELVGNSQKKITTLTHKYNDLCKVSGLKPKKQRMSVSGYVRTKVNIAKETIKEIKPLNTIESIAEYVNKRKDELYGLDVKENQLKLNERNGFNAKPTLIDADKFDDLDDNLNYNNPNEAKEGQYIKVYRGWGEKKYYDKYINGQNSYGEGGYIDGVGTYATDNEWSATQFAENDDDLLMELAIPSDAKFISYEDLRNLHYNIYTEYNNNRDKFLKQYGKKVIDILDIMNDNISSTAVLNNYDVTYHNDVRNWVLLNRSIIKVKNKKR